MFVVASAFFICSTPFLILDVISYNSVLGTHIKLYFVVLLFANRAVNFFVYACKHPDFKVVLGHMIRCSYEDIPNPSKPLKYLLKKDECCLCCYNIYLYFVVTVVPEKPTAVYAFVAEHTEGKRN